MYRKGTMRTIEVSDEVYGRLRHEAEVRGMTVEAYLEDWSDADAFVFTREHLAAIDRAGEDIAAGRVSSWNEAERWIAVQRGAPATSEDR